MSYQDIINYLSALYIYNTLHLELCRSYICYSLSHKPYMKVHVQDQAASCSP